MEEQPISHGIIALDELPEIHRHLDAEQAERYLMGNSPAGEVANLEEHLLICADCRVELSNADIYVSSMSEVAARFRKRTARLMAAVAAGLLVAGILALR